MRAKRSLRPFSYLLGGVLLAFGLSGPVQAQEATQLTGTVTNAAGQPIVSANVQIEGMRIGTTTNQEGRFLLVVPASRVSGQEVTVRANLIGRTSETQMVTLEPGASIVIDFTLSEDPLQLDEVVVAATGQRQLRREIGSDVGVVNVGEMSLAPIRNFDQLLKARTPGVTVTQSSGQAGAGSRVRIRGSNSISLSNSPLIIIDGIRVNDETNSFELFTGGQQTSRLNDLNPEEIESMEVVKGPSAAALYGTAAANGVIRIQTRSGGASTAGWRFWTEAGLTDRNIDFPDNVLAVDGAGAPCGTLTLASGACSGQAQTFRFNPLEHDTDTLSTTPFRTGWNQSYGASVSGGSQNTSYFVSGEWGEEIGVQEENRSDRTHLRANVSGQVLENLSLSARAGYTDTDAQLPQNDNSGLGVLLNGMLGAPTPGQIDAAQGYRLPRELLFVWDQFQEVTRGTLSGSMDWQPLSWLLVNATGGVDDVSRHDNDLVPPGELPFGPPFSSGFRESIKYDIINYTGTGDVTAEWSPISDLQTSTSVGVQYFRDREDWVFASGTDLTPGTESLAGASANFEADESNIENITFGAYVSERLNWDDRAYLNLAVRGDRNSAFGENLGWVWYPAFSGSWVISEESFFPSDTPLDQLRLRAAWGQSGLRPEFRDAKQFFEAVTAATATGEEPGFVLEGAGNVELEPETSTEFEVGFEASLLNRRMNVELTYYDKESKDALVERTLAPSLGATEVRIENIGAVSNTGWEFQIGGSVIQRTDVNWRVDFTGSTNDNEIESMGGVPPIVFGLLDDTQQHLEGYPAGGYFQRPIESFEDANGDGLIGTDEVEVGDEPEFLGKAFPDIEFTASTDIRLFQRVSVSALADFAGGHKLFNGTMWDRCTTVVPVCSERYDTDTPLETQAAIAAYAQAETVAGFIDDADYWRLREIAVSYDAPTEWANAFGGRSLRVSVAGRNLATWTDYTGLDPEVNASGQENFNTQDLYTLPPFRSFTLRLDVGF